MKLRFLLVLIVVAGCGEVSSTIVDAPPTTCIPACGAHATCQGTTCVCDDGYTDQGGACVDVNECMTNNGGCAAAAACTNTDGSRTCACNAGHVGDGLSCRQVWTLVSTHPFDIDPSSFGPAVVAVGARIFIGVETNTPAEKSFRSWDPVSMSLSSPLALPPTATDDFCACGATQNLTSDGTFIYMLGNYATRYDPSTNRWTDIPGYTSPTDFRVGEGAGVWNPAVSRVQVFGGRGPTSNTLEYNPASQVFTRTADLPFTLTEAVAYVSGGSVFVAGGTQTGTSDRILSRPATGGTWTTHVGASGDLSRPIGMGEFGARVWVATSNGAVFFYNPATMAWDRGIGTPVGTEAVVTTTSGTYALARVAGTLQIHKLSAIE